MPSTAMRNTVGDYEIRRAVSKNDMNQCFAIRQVVFVQEMGCPSETDVDLHDKHAVHLMAVSLNTVACVGTVRMYQKGSTGKIGRLAVVGQARGAKLGVALMLELLAVAEAMELEMLSLDAVVDRVPFYERLGYVVLDKTNILYEDGIPLLTMEKRISTSSSAPDAVDINLIQ